MEIEEKISRIPAFWEWFQSNAHRFERLDEDPDAQLSEILAELSKIEPELAVEKSKDKNPIELTISPEGIRDKFDIVGQIVAMAPAIDGWKMIAFRQPVDFKFKLNTGNLVLDPYEMFFETKIEGENLDVAIYGEGFDRAETNVLNHYCLVMLDNLIGEYNCVTQVRYYDFIDLLKAPDPSLLIPLSELKSFIENRKQEN